MSLRTRLSLQSLETRDTPDATPTPIVTGPPAPTTPVVVAPAPAPVTPPDLPPVVGY